MLIFALRIPKTLPFPFSVTSLNKFLNICFMGCLFLSDIVCESSLGHIDGAFDARANLVALPGIYTFLMTLFCLLKYSQQPLEH